MNLPAGTYPIWRIAQSQKFTERYGDLATRYPNGIKAHEAADAPFAELLRQRRLVTSPDAIRINVPDRGGRERPFVAEAFFNQHVQLLFLAERGRIRTGRPVRLAS